MNWGHTTRALDVQALRFSHVVHVRVRITRTVFNAFFADAKGSEYRVMTLIGEMKHLFSVYSTLPPFFSQAAYLSFFSRILGCFSFNVLQIHTQIVFFFYLMSCWIEETYYARTLKKCAIIPYVIPCKLFAWENADSRYFIIPRSVILPMNT